MDLDRELGGFPYRCTLSLAPLVAFWERAFEGGSSSYGALAASVRQGVQQAPELLGAIEDVAVLERHRDLVDLLMTAVFAPAAREQEYGAALFPFRLRPFHATPGFRRVLMGEHGCVRGRLGMDEGALARTRLVPASRVILRQVYGVDVDVEFPIVVTASDPSTGLDRHFRVQLDPRFLQVTVSGPVPPLDEATRERLRRDLLDPDYVLSVLPPDRFAIQGFTVVRAVDVTDQEVLSSIQRDLIDRESIVSAQRFLALRDKLRVLLGRPELRFGLGALNGEQVLLLHGGNQLEHACIFADSMHFPRSEFAGSVFERAVVEERTLIVPDLAAEPRRTRLEEEMLSVGTRAMVVAPLRYQGRVIGTLGLKSPVPGGLDASDLPKLNEVLPLFAVAVQRSMDELNSRVQAVIKERCTAIHPSVEWRFRRAVLRMIERRQTGGEGDGEMEPIVFEDVHPLYAISDIRGSSVQRVAATQADLAEQLRLAGAVVDAAHAARTLPALDELRYRIRRQATQVERGLDSGEELGVIAFLRTEVERLLDHLAGFGPAVGQRVEDYRAALDPRARAVYRRRREFEESVARLSDAIAGYLDLEQQAAQAMFPHYFELQKTDGVDYQIYVGASLAENGRFDALYLRNLRLWQLMVTCGVTLRAEQVKATLPLALDTTQLILVQHAPLTLRFRLDEKRFGPEGAYDVRYEIVKKRIDKALVRGTAERLTQPGRIAIVYSQASEAAEYRGYIAYLQHLGHLGPEVEELELEELQGVHGLRALRVTVDLANPHLARAIPAAELGVAAR